MLLSAELIGLAAGFLTAFSTFPQSLKIIKNKNSEGISAATILMLNVSYLLWLIYGISLNLVSVIVWNVVALMFGTVIFYLKFFPKVENDKQDIYINEI